MSSVESFFIITTGSETLFQAQGAGHLDGAGGVQQPGRRGRGQGLRLGDQGDLAGVADGEKVLSCSFWKKTKE